jgi:uncharacterized membrane protein
MLILVLGLLIFLGVHSVRMLAGDWRTRQIERLGQLTWKGLYAALSIAGFALIVWGFSLARTTPDYLWYPPRWTHHLAALLMLLAFILLTAAYVPGNRIKAKVGHPMLLAVKVWAVAHLLANGTLADIIMFAAFLIWSVANFIVSRRRDRQAGVTYPATGIWPDVLVAGIGLVAFVLFAHFGHRWLIGVDPFGRGV